MLLVHSKGNFIQKETSFKKKLHSIREKDSRDCG
jgi:hypothetical protein